MATTDDIGRAANAGAGSHDSRAAAQQVPFEGAVPGQVFPVTVTGGVACYPEPFATWYGTEYPAGRGQRQPLKGWCCSGCGRGYAPHIPMCHYCGPGQQPAFIGKADTAPMGDWEDEA
jgi:hypothetical protein